MAEFFMIMVRKILFFSIFGRGRTCLLLLGSYAYMTIAILIT